MNLVTAGIRDASVRRALDQMVRDDHARHLRGLYADRPETAPYGAEYQCDDAAGAEHAGEIYKYWGDAVGWLMMFGEKPTTGDPTVLHNKLTDLEGGGGGHWYHSNQGINDSDSPTFAALTTTGDLDVGDILFLYGRYATLHGTPDHTYEVLHAAGQTSDYIVSLQDGTGRVQELWNSSPGSSPTFLVAAEDASKRLIDTSGQWTWYRAEGGSAAAGDPITWDPLLYLGATSASIYKDLHLGGHVYINTNNRIYLGDSQQVSLYFDGTYGRLE